MLHVFPIALHLLKTEICALMVLVPQVSSPTRWWSHLPPNRSKRKYVLCWYWSHKFQVQLADGAIFHQSSIHRFQDQLGLHRILFLFSMMLHRICEFQAVKALASLPELAHEPVGTDAAKLDASQRSVHNSKSLRKSIHFLSVDCTAPEEYQVCNVHGLSMVQSCRQQEWLFKFSRIRALQLKN